MIKKYILRIDSITKKVIETTVIALFVVLILYLVYALLYASVISDTNLSINTTLRQIIKLIAVAMFVTFLIAVCIRLLLSPFVKPDEETEFEHKVDYVLAKRKQQKQPAASAPHSPLINLTVAEEECVCTLLKDLPEHISKPGHINLAQTMHYMTALQQIGNLDDKDLYNLRLWLAEVTGKEIPSSSQFNEAYPSKATTKVAKAKLHIEKALAEIR